MAGEYTSIPGDPVGNSPPAGISAASSPTVTAPIVISPTDFQSVSSHEKALKERSRLVVVEHVYHQGPNEEPTVAESRFSRFLDSDEQPYGPRTVKVFDSWRPLDIGWLTCGSGMMVVKNTGKSPLVIGLWVPAPERLEDIWSGEVIPFAQIRPGESGCRMEPLCLDRLRIRSEGPEGKYSITLVPY